MSCSIHLGNYILVVQPPTPRRPDRVGSQGAPGDGKKGKKGKPTAEVKPVAVKTISTAGQGMGALDFELSWLRFLREAEDDYQKRLCRNDTSKPLSIFDMNIDLFETYLLKASGRALSSTQHLNLNLTSAMVSHLKLFDTSHPEAPTEEEQEREAEEDIALRRLKRMERRRKRRRATASFNEMQQYHQHVDEEEVTSRGEPPVVEQPLIQQQPVSAVKRRPMLDSLNERDERETGEEGNGNIPHIQEEMEDSHEEFDVNDRSQTIKIDKNLLEQHMLLDDYNRASLNIQDQETHDVVVHELQQPEKQRSVEDPQPVEYFLDASVNPIQDQIQSQTLRDFRASQLYPDSIIQSDEGGLLQHHNEAENNMHGKIMIGDQSIDDNFGDDHTLNLGADGQPMVHNFTDDDELLNEDDIDGGNPFRRNKSQVSFIKEQSIVSQGSIPLDHFGATNNSQNFIATGPSGFGMKEQLGATIESLSVPVKAKDDFDQYKSSPSMPEIYADGSGLMHHVLQHDITMIDALVNSPQHSPKKHHEIAQGEVVLGHRSHKPTIHVGPIEEPPLVLTQLETPTLNSELELCPTTAQPTQVQPAIIPEIKASIVEPLPPVMKSPPPLAKAEMKEFVQQTSFKSEHFQEPEVVMRFEVAVGMTPRDKSVGNLSVAEPSAEHKEKTLNESSIHRALEDEAHQSRGRHSPNTSVERAPVDNRGHSHSRLEVTLTAEPDKPIMVEVRGGEKQFLISALTKHIYDILSQPHKLKLGSGYNQQQQEYDTEEEQEYEQEQEEVDDDEDQVKQIQIGKNLNLKLKSLKKNLKKVPVQTSQSAEEDVMNAITIEHLDQSESRLIDDQTPKKSNSPKKKQAKSPLNESKSNNHQQMMIQQNWPTPSPVNKSSNRSSMGPSALAPLNVVPGEENMRLDHHHHPQQLTAPPQRRTERFALHEVRYDQISKRTTEEAYQDAKIREEVHLTQIFDSETANSMIGNPARRESATAQDRNRKHNDTLNQSIVVQPPPVAKLDSRRKTQNSLQQVQVMSDEVVMTNYPMLNRSSRPETATFNMEHPLMHIPSQTELPPINMKSSQLSNRLHQGQQPRTPKYHPGGSMLNMNSSTHNLVGYEEEIIQTEKPRRGSRRAQTPDDNHQKSMIDDNNGEIGPPVEVEQFSLPPLQPQVPMPHPNGYFSSEASGDYMILNRQDSQNYILMTAATNGEQDDSQVPQVNYYDAYANGGLIQGENAYYQYSPNGYPEPSENETAPDEYILAEGYLLHFKEGKKKTEVAGVVERQVYDLSRNHPPSLQHQAQPKVVLQRQGTHAQHERSGYLPPHYPNNSRKASKFPVVQQKKRVLGSSAQGANMIYGLNGGPAYRTMPYTPERSMSPMRRKNFVHYTANIDGPTAAQQQQMEQYQQSSIMAAPHQIQEVAYYSQSPQPNRMRPSPYMSDAEFKILHDFYDIQCEPTGLHRGGVPLMRVKRINRPLNNTGMAAAAGGKRTYNIFNFAEELGGAAVGNSTVGGGSNQHQQQQQQSLNKSSFQIIYPQYQPNSPFKQDYLMQRTLANPSKWFDRFYQSTRNLNQTISKLHKQHSRKLRSYSVTSLTSGEQGVQNTIGARDAVYDHALYHQKQMGSIEGQVNAMRDSNPKTDGRYQNELSTTQSSSKPLKKTSASAKSGVTNSAAVFMPPLHKIYSANMSHDQATAILQTAAAEKGTNKKPAGKLPPRPVGGGSIFKQNTVPGDHKTSGAAPVIIPPAILSAGSSNNGGVNSAATQ